MRLKYFIGHEESEQHQLQQVLGCEVVQQGSSHCLSFIAAQDCTELSPVSTSLAGDWRCLKDHDWFRPLGLSGVGVHLIHSRSTDSC